jgi:TldD protein
LPAIDRDFWTAYVEKASATASLHAGIKNSHVSLQVKHQTRLFVNSDGSQVAESQAFWQLEAYLWHLSDKGDGIPWTISHFVNDPAELPDLKNFRKEIRTAARLLEKIAAAPRFHSYSGPVLLDPIPAGLLIHEAMGHRLEGNRLRSGGEARTFADSLGKPVLPEFLSLNDHPQDSHLELPNGELRTLVGHYRYDDEGTPSTTADLISGGKLAGFLTSRVPIQRRHASNGHARSSHHERAISRMGVTHLQSEHSATAKELKAKLLEEVQRQNLPYGIRILNASSGETTTDAYDFQAFLGEINLAARIFPDGREELIRGVNFVGTPLNAVQGIIAAGDDPVIDNAWCGAESGMVPVSTISPSLLIRNLELQSKADTPYTQYFYPMP